MQFHLPFHEFTLLFIYAQLLLISGISKMLLYLPEDTKIIQLFSELQQICTGRYKLHFLKSCPARNEFPRLIISHYDELTHIFPLQPCTIGNQSRSAFKQLGKFTGTWRV